jgi:hypothetical protein
MDVKSLVPWSAVTIAFLGMAATLTANDPRAAFHGATTVFTYSRDGDTLTQVRTPAGPSTNRVTIKLARIE